MKSISKVVVALALMASSVYAENTMHIVVNNHLGAPEMLIDQNQHVVWQAEYDEFGKATLKVEEVEFNHRLPGQYYDKETGLHYNYYRDYDPSLGRYVQSDPIGLAGGINTYGYVLGNPISWIDFYGLAVDLNLFNQTSDSFMSNAAGNVPDNGNFQIGGHGNSAVMADQNGNLLSPQDLLNLANVNGYNQGQTIELQSCNTGNGQNNFAEKLSQLCQCTVVAPDNYVWYYLDGQTIVAPYSNASSGQKPQPDLNNPGAMNVFK